MLYLKLAPGVPAGDEDKFTPYRAIRLAVEGVALLGTDVRAPAFPWVYVHQEAARPVVIDWTAPAIPAQEWGLVMVVPKAAFTPRTKPQP